MLNRTPRNLYATALIFLLVSMALAACVPPPEPTPTSVPTLDASPVDEATTPEPEAQTEPEEAVAEETPAEETEPAVEEAAEEAAETVAEEDTVDETAATETTTVAFNSWTIEQLYGANTLGGVPVTAEFISDTELVGWTGCNDYAATFATGDGNTIQVTEVNLTSDNACRSDAATAQELLFQKALSEARSFDISGADLTLSDAADAPTLTMRNAAVLALADTTWAVTGYDDTLGSFVPVMPDGPALTLNLPQNAVNGFSGCNNYSGTAEVSGNSVSIGNISNTGAGTGSATCAEGGPLLDQEAAYRKALTLATTWEITGPHLTLFGEDGNPVAAFIAGPALSGASE